MKTQIYIIISGILLIACAALGIMYFMDRPEEANEITTPTSFIECAAMGYPVMESYPRKCQDPAGNIFTEVVIQEPSPTNEAEPVTEEDEPEDVITAHNDFITVDSPKGNSVITSPLTISGEARGSWYSEAVFPIVLTDANGVVIAEAQARATEDWMTTEFVPFEATLEFTRPDGEVNGTLILKKDNPSGLPENDDSLEIPVSFE